MARTIGEAGGAGVGTWILTILGDSSHGFFSQVLNGVTSTLSTFSTFGAKPLNPVVCSHDDKPWVEESILRMFAEQPVAGLILAASIGTNPNGPLIQSYLQRDLPLVQIDRRVVGIDSAWVGIDNAAAGYAAARHLAKHDHERVALVGGRPDVSTNQLRFEGYVQAMSEINARPVAHWGCSEWDTSRAAVKALLDGPQRPAALLCINGMATLGAMMAIKDSRLECPHDVALIGFDDNPWCLLPNPAITMVRQPARSIGEKAADLIWRGIHGEALGSDHFLPWDLLIRESCGCMGSETRAY